MKTIFAIMSLTLSMGAFAQEKIILNSETALVNSTEATLFRNAETPGIVKVLFNVPMTRNVCVKYRRTSGGRGSQRKCVKYEKVTTNQADKVKINFEKLPALGGSEEETFSVKAVQRRIDSENVIYTITSTTNSHIVIKKGILGYDSYVIELKADK
jgi:hypothetical protein